MNANCNMNRNHMNTCEKQVDWKVIESYFQNKHLERMVRHQIESYDHFVNNQIKKTIEMFNPVTIHSDHDKDEKTGLYSLEIIITFSNFQIYRPQIHENNGATKNNVSTRSSTTKFYLFLRNDFGYKYSNYKEDW